MTLADDGRIAGHYTLSSASVPLSDLLLADARSRAAQSQIMAFGLIVEATFDRHQGFLALANSARRLFLPLAR